MSTPLKALIQERLRAKIVRQDPDYDVDDEYACDSDRLLRQSVDVTAYDISSRGGDDEDTLVSSSSRGSTTRHSNSTQPSFPVRLHTHIDASAYLVPSQHDDRCYPPSISYGSSNSSHGVRNRQQYSRYPREQYRELDAYSPPPRPEQQQHSHHRRRHHSHQRVREQQQPHYEPPSRGGCVSRHPSQNRAVSPWHTAAPNKSSSMSRSPLRAASSATHSSTSRGYRKQDFDYPDHFDNADCMRHSRESKSLLPSPRFTAPSSSTHQTHRQDDFQRQRYVWKDRDHDYDNQAAYEVREPSPTRHHDHNDYPAFDEPVRRSSAHRSHSNQTDNDNARRYSVAALPSPHKPKPEEIYLTQSAKGSERHSPLALDMDIIEPPAKTTGRTRAWDDIMSPKSRLAAKAFVEKRQRRTQKGTPRTVATQRWLAVIDARARKQEAIKQQVN